ncbi:MAG: trigger factor [Pseudomonadota bacterium]
MDISVENTGDLGRKVTVQVPSDQIDSKVDGRLREMAQHVRLKGFRPGKVPFKVLQQRFGREVRNEIVGQVIEESFRQALVEKQLRPASTPSIEPVGLDGGADLSFTASFEVFPEIAELKVEALDIERVDAEVGDGDVDAMIETLREQRRSWDDKADDAKAGDGDLSFFFFRVTFEDGSTYPDGDEDGRAGAILGQGAFDAGFEGKLVGLGKGDEFEFDLDFDENARDAELAGKKGAVKGNVERVQQATIPEVDDEFMQSFGVESGEMNDFREEVRSNLERELKQALSRSLRSNVIAGLIEQYDDLAIPSGMIDQEMGAMHQQAQAQIQQMGGDPSQAPAPDAFREQAEKRVRGALVISEVSRHAALEVDMGRVRDMVNEIASTYDDPQAVAQIYYEREDLLQNVQNVVLEEQAVEWVIDRANVSDVTKSFDDVMNRAKEEDNG